MDEKQIIDEVQNTSEYKQIMEKARNYTKEEWDAINDKQLDIILVFIVAKRNGESFSSDNTQKAVALFVDFISTFYYDCNPRALRSIARVYEIDSDFKKTVNEIEPDAAKFIADAINYYCEAHQAI